MKPHKRHLLLLLVPLAALPLISTMAGAESTPTMAAVNEGPPTEEHHSWSPETTMVGAGGTVAFTNAGPVAHGIEWINTPSTPACNGVPVGNSPAASGAVWSGTCTFAQRGVYTFYCTVHGPSMQGRVVVGANGITTITMTTTQSSSTLSGTTTTTTSTTPGAPSTPVLPGLPLVGSPATAIKLAANQHSQFVRGSVDVAQSGIGGKLEVEVLARKTLLTKKAVVARSAVVAKPSAASRNGRAAQTRVGRLVRLSLPAGLVSFKVSLNPKARRALRAHRRLPLTVKVTLTPKQGAAVTATRTVVLHVK
jgi:plastocyanin